MKNTQSMNHSKHDTPTQFTFPAPTAQQVALVGDFNNWDTQAMPMSRSRDGIWKRKVLLQPGHHEYRFVVDGEWQDDPAATVRVANSMGTENCVANVPG